MISMKKENKKINLLIVCTVPTELNGITNVVFNLLAAMDRRSFRIGYVAINEPNEFYRTKLDSMDVALYVIPRKLSAPLRYVWNLAKIARDYDIMHVHGNSATMVLEMIAAKIAKVRIRAAHSHNTTCSLKKIDSFSRPLFHALCNLRFACGKEAGKWLYGKRSFIIVNNGIDCNRFVFNESDRYKIRKELDIDNEILIGHVGNFVEAKNHSFLIDVFKAVLDRGVDARLLLLGYGKLREEIENHVHVLNIDDKVIFMGSVNNTNEYLSAMDLVVMPSLFEGLPLTLVEEQANGLPILVSDAITPEANMTCLVKFKTLNNSKESWAADIVDIFSDCKRNLVESQKAIKKIKDSGYDINIVSQNLVQTYKQALRSINPIWNEYKEYCNL